MFYQRLKELWKNPSKELKEVWLGRFIEWRRSNAVVRIIRPTRLDRARTLGYKAKPGIFLARVRVLRGGRKRRRSLKTGRRSKAARAKKIVDLNYQAIAERRANRNFKNCEVLNSYFVAKDGRYAFYEVILVDRNHPQITNDVQLKGLAGRKGRAYRGLTSAARKSRGLRAKGNGADQLRPSRAAKFKKKDNKQRK
jgi:large subunit ribosomal protein L15e